MYRNVNMYLIGTSEKIEWTRYCTIFAAFMLMFLQLLWKNKFFIAISTRKIAMLVEMCLEQKYVLINKIALSYKLYRQVFKKTRPIVITSWAINVQSVKFPCVASVFLYLNIEFKISYRSKPNIVFILPLALLVLNRMGTQSIPSTYK